MIFFGSWVKQFVPGDSPTKTIIKLKILERRLRRNHDKNVKKEKKLLKRIKKMVAKGDTEEAKIEARIIVSNRKYSRNFLKMASRVRNIRLKFEHAVVFQSLSENLSDITSSLKEMNKVTDVDELDRVMANLELQMGEIEIKEEAIEDSMDLVSYSEDEEQEIENILQMVSAADLAEKM
ncbi:MAG: Snf7 family protein, partial [Candidatus Hodarchaeales archaeon]